MKGSPPRTSCNHSSKETRPNILWNQVLTIGTTTNAQLCEAMQDLYKMRIACGEPQSPTHYRHVGSVTKGNPKNGNLGIKPLIVSKVTFKPEKIPLNGKPKPPPPKGPRPPRPTPPKMSESFKTASKIVVAEGSESFETAATKRSSTAHWEGPKPITFDGGYEVDND